MNWDTYFLNICNTISTNSKCLSRKVGAVIVRDKSMISSGYNGPPSGVSPCNERYFKDQKLISIINKEYLQPEKYDVCPRYYLGFKSGEGLEWCVAGHAERNTIVNAAKNGVCVKDCVMYMNCGIPCTPCLVEIINSGIKEIVVINLTYYDLMGEYLIKESGLKVRINSSVS
jgi:dCMP deaminase